MAGLFHRLRASLATDLSRDFPQQIVAAWLAHTEAVAEVHYWQVTQDRLIAAIEWGLAQRPAWGSQRVAKNRAVMGGKATNTPRRPSL